MMKYPDHVTRYNHRQTLLLDAPRTYSHPIRESSTNWWDVAIIFLSVSALIAVSVIILQSI